MCLLKVLFKSNSVTCRESWYTTKKHIRKKEWEKKKSFGIYYLYLLKLLKMTYGSLSRSGTGQFGIEYYISIHI